MRSILYYIQFTTEKINIISIFELLNRHTYLIDYDNVDKIHLIY